MASFVHAPERPMKAVIVPGMFQRDGGLNSIGRMLPRLRQLGYTAELIDPGFWHVLRLYFGRRFNMDQKVSRALWNADLIIGHSFGAVIIDRALRLLPITDKERVLVLVNPSLNADTDVPETVKHRFVMFSRSDLLVRLSGWLPFLRLGRMGAIGYTGESEKNSNIDITQELDFAEHSDWENADKYAQWAHELRISVIT